jgi:heme exporter protein A
LSFELEAGQSIAITGSNGSGKSTLLKILSGILTPSAGTVTLLDHEQEVRDEERPFHTSLVAPYLNVYDGLSARENLEFVASVRRLKHAQDQIRAMLNIVGLEGRKDDLVATYSSGMKQRVKYAAALLVEPAVLLLDEPSANLDTVGLAMVGQVMKIQREAGRLLIVATNDADEASACDASLNIEDYS